MSVSMRLWMMVMLAGCATADVRAQGDFAADRRQVREMVAMYDDPNVLVADPEQAVRLWQNLAPAERYRSEVSQVHRALIDDAMPRYPGFAANVERLGTVLREFRAATAKFAEKAPGRIEEELREAVRRAEAAVTEADPEPFLKTLPAQLQSVAGRIELLGVMLGADHAAVSRAREKYARAREKVTGLQGRLREAIIRENEPPADLYEGEDRAELVKNFRNVWEKNHPDDKVLGVRIPAEGWTQVRGWTWVAQARQWRRYELSELQAWVAVRMDARHVVVYEVLCLAYEEDEGVTRRYRVGNREDPPVQWIFRADKWEAGAREE